MATKTYKSKVLGQVTIPEREQEDTMTRIRGDDPRRCPKCDSTRYTITGKVGRYSFRCVCRSCLDEWTVTPDRRA